MFETKPEDGKEPEYLVGILAAASAIVAARKPLAVNAMTFNITPSPFASNADVRQ
jgi:hypothetical protein